MQLKDSISYYSMYNVHVHVVGPCMTHTLFVNVLSFLLKCQDINIKELSSKLFSFVIQSILTSSKNIDTGYNL